MGADDAALEQDAADADRRDAARRGRRFVRLAKPVRFALAAVAVLTIVVVLVWPQIQPRVDRLRVGMATLDVVGTDAEGLVNARLSGNDARDRPFTITAEFVRQLAGAPNTLGLDEPRGSIVMEDGTKTTIRADGGTFAQDSSMLALTGNVVLLTGDGARYETASAQLDLGSGTASGTEPVRGEGPFGTVTGEGFRAVDYGDTIFVTGRSTLVVPEPQPAEPS
ncbi:MAG: LPS export ABC transporter periplasmic protein LptC [Rhodospirillales bacterium]|jgi:lipopolysaccharide export system protein LptC|nr:LPS export ABC transporter periplasmic protein LptC [Rhodospirillales bacterium]